MSNLPKDENGNIKRSPGRPKGSRNKNTHLLNEMYDLANKPENKAKLLAYIQGLIDEDPEKFWVNYWKLMPRDIKADINQTTLDAKTILDAMLADEDEDGDE